MCRAQHNEHSAVKHNTLWATAKACLGQPERADSGGQNRRLEETVHRRGKCLGPGDEQAWCVMAPQGLSLGRSRWVQTPVTREAGEQPWTHQVPIPVSYRRPPSSKTDTLD